MKKYSIRKSIRLRVESDEQREFIEGLFRGRRFSALVNQYIKKLAEEEMGKNEKTRNKTL